MPPSAITGTPASAASSTVSMMAVSCGTPTPATTRVVQIEPGPMPTLTASAPASISACAPSAVATLPAITWVSFDRALDRGDGIEHAPGMAVRGVDDDDVDAGVDQRARRARKPVLADAGGGAARAAGPARPCRRAGWASAFSMSLTVIRPMQRQPSSTTSSFSMRCWCSRRLASSRLTPSLTVTRPLRGHQLARPAGAGRRRSARRGWSGCRPGGRLAGLDHGHAGDAVPLPSAPAPPASGSSGPIVTGLTTMPPRTS